MPNCVQKREGDRKDVSHIVVVWPSQSKVSGHLAWWWIIKGYTHAQLKGPRPFQRVITFFHPQTGLCLSRQRNMPPLRTNGVYVCYHVAIDNRMNEPLSLVDWFCKLLCLFVGGPLLVAHFLVSHFFNDPLLVTDFLSTHIFDDLLFDKATFSRQNQGVLLLVH